MVRDRMATSEDLKFWCSLILSSVSDSKILRVMFLLIATYTYFNYRYRKYKSNKNKF